MFGLFQPQMFLPHLCGGEDADELCAFGGLLNLRTSSRLLSLHQANHAGDLKAKFACGLDCLDGGGSRGADIINDHNARAHSPKALDALSRTVLLFLLTDDESVDIEAAGI